MATTFIGTRFLTSKTERAGSAGPHYLLWWMTDSVVVISFL